MPLALACVLSDGGRKPSGAPWWTFLTFCQAFLWPISPQGARVTSCGGSVVCVESWRARVAAISAEDIAVASGAAWAAACHAAVIGVGAHITRLALHHACHGKTARCTSNAAKLHRENRSCKALAYAVCRYPCVVQVALPCAARHPLAAVAGAPDHIRKPCNPITGPQTQLHELAPDPPLKLTDEPHFSNNQTLLFLLNKETQKVKSSAVGEGAEHHRDRRTRVGRSSARCC